MFARQNRVSRTYICSFYQHEYVEVFVVEVFVVEETKKTVLWWVPRLRRNPKIAAC